MILLVLRLLIKQAWSTSLQAAKIKSKTTNQPKSLLALWGSKQSTPAPCHWNDAEAEAQPCPGCSAHGSWVTHCPRSSKPEQHQPSPVALGLPTAVSQALFMAGSYTVVAVTRSLQQHVLTWCNFPVKTIPLMSRSSFKTNKQHSCWAQPWVLQECPKMPVQGTCKLFSHVLQIQFDATVKCQVRLHICSASALIMAALNGFH